MKNPYSVVFGIEPAEYVDRLRQLPLFDEFVKENYYV